MKLPTIILGIPYLSLLIVNEKQQLMYSSGSGSANFAPGLDLDVLPMGPDAGDAVEGILITGLNRNTQEVRTAF